jgi:hypothetical protein
MIERFDETYLRLFLISLAVWLVILLAAMINFPLGHLTYEEMLATHRDDVPEMAYRTAISYFLALCVGFGVIRLQRLKQSDRLLSALLRAIMALVLGGYGLYVEAADNHLTMLAGVVLYLSVAAAWLARNNLKSGE